MELLCSYDQCKIKVQSKCHCNKNTNFFCCYHEEIHLKEQGPHSLQEIVHSDNPQQREIINSAYLLIQEICKSRRKVLEEYERLHREIESQTETILKKLEELEVLSENLAKSAADIVEKEFSKNLYVDYILTLDYSLICTEVNSWQAPEIEIHPLSLSKIYNLSPLSAPFTHFPLSLEHSPSISLYELHHSVTKTISYFKQNTKVFITINVESMEKTETELNIPENMPYGAGIVELPGGNLFHAGGTLGNPIGSCYLLKNGKIEKLQSFRPRAAPAVAYCDGKVYAIGGRDGKYVKECEVFNLVTKEWKSLTPIPETSNGLSAVSFASQILISGYFHKKIYCFDTFTHAYSEVFDVPEGNKVLTIGNGNAYVICNRKLFESSFGNVNEWRFVTEVSYAGGWCVNHPIRVNNYIYFLVDYSQKELWRFELTNKELLLVCRY